MYVRHDEMIEWLDTFDHKIADAIATRLHSHVQHIDYLEQRLRLAERVVGELYLMTQEIDE